MEIRHYETENCFPRIPIIAITASAMVGESRILLRVGHGRLCGQTVLAARARRHPAKSLLQLTAFLEH
jgi:hypothetical protein